MTEPEPKKTMKPRTGPKRYAAGTGAPSVAEVLPAGKVQRAINVEGPVWAKAKERGKVDRLSVSHVSEQLLDAYGDGAFEFYADGMLVPPAPTPTTVEAREVLRKAARKALTGMGSDVDADALADALTSACERAGYVRPVSALDRIGVDLDAIQDHAAQVLAPGLGWDEVPTLVYAPERARRAADALQQTRYAITKLRDGYTMTDAIAPRDAESIRDTLTEADGYLDSAQRDAPDGVPAAADEIAERIHRAAELVAKAARRRQRSAP